MTAEEYTIERLMRLDKEVDTLWGLNKRAEENCDFLVNKVSKIQKTNCDLREKLELVKQIIILTLENEPDLSSDIMLYRDDAEELIKILDIKIDKEVPDEVPED